MSLKGRFVASSLWSVGASVFDNMASLFTFIVLARILTPFEFGTVAFALIFISLSRVFVLAGIPDALIRREAWDEKFASTAFWTNSAIGIALALGLCLGAAPLVIAFYDRTFGLVLAALSATLVIEGLTAVHIAKLRRDFQHKIIARRGIATNIISSVIGVALALTGWGVWAIVISRVVAVSSTSLILWRASSFRPQLHFSMNELTEIARFSGAVLGSQLLNQAGSQLPAIFLGTLLGPAAIGQYRVGARPFELITNLIIVPLQSTAVSALSRRASDRESLGKAYTRLTSVCAFLSCPIFFGIAAVSPDFVELAFGPQWHEAGHVLLATCLIVGATTLGYFESPTLNAAGRSDLTFLTSLVGSIGNVIGGLIGLQSGAVGVAAALTIRAHVTMPFALSLIRTATGIRARQAVTNIAGPYLAAALMFGMVTCVRLLLLDDHPLVMRLVLCISLGGVLYVVLMLSLFRNSATAVLNEVAPLLPERLRGKWGSSND